MSKLRVFSRHPSGYESTTLCRSGVLWLHTSVSIAPIQRHPPGKHIFCIDIYIYIFVILQETHAEVIMVVTVQELTHLCISVKYEKGENKDNRARQIL